MAPRFHQLSAASQHTARHQCIPLAATPASPRRGRGGGGGGSRIAAVLAPLHIFPASTLFSGSTAQRKLHQRSTLGQSISPTHECLAPTSVLLHRTELVGRMAATLLLICLARLGHFIPIPGTCALGSQLYISAARLVVHGLSIIN
jgi:hypothetical protein